VVVDAVIWDFNGTLIDDVDLVVRSVNVQLAKRGLPRLTVERYRDLFGFPVADYYRRIGLDPDAEPMSELSAEFFEAYAPGLPSCPLRDGVLDALAAFRDAGVRQFVLSAMEERLLSATIEHLGIGRFFVAVCGLSHLEGDSKVERGRELLAGFAIRPESAILIGDTDHDAEVASALGLSTVLIARGHQSEARLRAYGRYTVVRSFREFGSTLSATEFQARVEQGSSEPAASSPNVKWAEARISASSKMVATLNARHGHTGREVRCNEQYAGIREWAELPTRAQQLRDPKAKQFRECVLSARTVGGQCLVCFRGRFIRRGYPHGAESIGPPCRQQAAAGRYNKEGEPVLYLCDTEDGVKREFGVQKKRGRLFCQRFSIPISALRIADFRGGDPNSMTSQVFSIAEDCGVQGRGPDSYTFSQTVAEIVRQARFDGMVIPGVRGDRERHYCNVVIFDPWRDERWRSWVERSAASL